MFQSDVSDSDYSTLTSHEFKITKEQAGIYITCCGDEVRYYTSNEFGLPASNGWYITQENGNFDANRFYTLADVKKFLIKYHGKIGA